MHNLFYQVLSGTEKCEILKIAKTWETLEQQKKASSYELAHEERELIRKAVRNEDYLGPAPFIKAVKMIRNRHGIPLKKAKEIADHHRELEKKIKLQEDRSV